MQEPKDSEDRKNEFIDVAEKLFKENGIVDTTINSIVKDMNVAKGLFYYYFKSKDDVIDAISEKYNEIFNEMMQEAMDQPTYEACLHQFIVNSVHSFYELNESLNGQGDLSTLVMKSKQEAMRVSSVELAKILEQGNKNGSLEIQYPKYYAEIIISGINTLIEEGEATQEQIVEIVMGLIMKDGKEQ